MRITTGWMVILTVLAVTMGAHAGDELGHQLYLSTNNATNTANDIHLIRDIQRGVFSLDNPGQTMSITTRNVEQDGGLPAGFGLTTVRTTEMPLNGEAKVVVGTTNGYVLTYDANLSGRVHTTDICNGCGKAAQEVNQLHAFIAARVHTSSNKTRKRA